MRLAFAAHRAGDAPRRARPDDPRHRAADDRRRPRPHQPTSRGSSPRTSSRRPRRRRCGASSATATAASGCCEIALAVFVAASALCGVAQDLTQLVVVRGVQGVAAGGLMTLAMAAVGDLVSPRERGRYQGYIAATFAVATVARPADRRPARRARELALGLLRQPAARRRRARRPARAAAAPAPASRPAPPLDVAGAALLAGATGALMLACVWGGERYAWGSPDDPRADRRRRRARRRARGPRAPRAGPDRPARAAAHPAVAVASAALFLGTAALFAVTVFVPLFLQTATGATPTEAGLLLVADDARHTLSTNAVRAG